MTGLAKVEVTICHRALISVLRSSLKLHQDACANERLNNADASRGASKPGSDSDPELSSESSPEAVKKQPSKKRGRPAREAPRADDLDDDYDPDRAKVS